MSEITLSVNEQIEVAEKVLLKLPQTPCPVDHHFAPDVYIRHITMPAGTFIIGQKHKTKHFNIVLSGRAKVMMDGVAHDIVAPSIFVSEPGVRKILYILEDMTWATVHPTHETDVEVLTDLLVEPSGAFMEHKAEIEELKRLMTRDNIYLN